MLNDSNYPSYLATHFAAYLNTLTVEFAVHRQANLLYIEQNILLCIKMIFVLKFGFCKEDLKTKEGTI